MQHWIKKNSSKKKFKNIKLEKVMSIKQMENLTENPQVVTKNFKFDSKKEYLHALKFLQDEKEGKIKHYIFKPPRIEVCPGDKSVKFRPVHLYPDHLIVDNNNQISYFDSKGFETRDSILKRKFIYFRHKIYIHLLR